MDVTFTGIGALVSKFLPKTAERATADWLLQHATECVGGKRLAATLLPAATHPILLVATASVRRQMADYLLLKL